MKIDFSLPTKGNYHQFCLSCHSESIERVILNRKTYYLCNNCQKLLEKSLVIDDKIEWWIDKRTGEYWHESVGVFVHTRESDVLVFDRNIYPFAYTIPAGHLNKNELPKRAAQRELLEETGLELNDLNLFTKENVIGDSCRRGADSHKWHLYTLSLVKKPQSIRLNDEGSEPKWLKFDLVRKRGDLVFPLRYFIDKYGKKLLS